MLSFFISAFHSLHLSFSSFHFFILPIVLSLFLSIHLTIFLSLCLVYLSVDLSFFSSSFRPLSFSFSISLSLFLSLSIYLSLSIPLSDTLPCTFDLIVITYSTQHFEHTMSTLYPPQIKIK